MKSRTTMRRSGAAAACLAASIALMLTAGPARAAQPITIGFGMALSGGLAAAGKSALLAMQIWAADTNAKGGLLGRPVKLIYYDDQSNPPTVPGIYTKLIDVDKADFIVSGYGTNMTAPAMPVAIAHNRLFLGLFALAVNSEFHYPRYFSMLPAGPDPKHAFSEPFFQVIMKGKPAPKTLAIVGADAEYPRNALEGARDIAKEDGLKIVYDKTYPPSTADYTPIIQAIQATHPDAVFVASYPPDSAGMLRAAIEVGLKTRYFGGGMVGFQYTTFKEQFGPKLNGILDYDWWIPAPTMQFPGIMDFLKKYQAKAPAEGVDPLGWYLPPFAYAELQVLADAVEATKSLDQNKVADYIRTHPFKTIVGDIRFGKDGEWSKPRVLEVQWQNITSNKLADFKNTKTEAILEPAQYRTGTVEAPYLSIKK
ncbi:MAG TPA: amino acid ABC transporter substrate-binding protein [Stellaceae bacterium]|nr:amino acid ABC transporter substrate-binding protein [Stellaceae bacterium]